MAQYTVQDLLEKKRKGQVGWAQEVPRWRCAQVCMLDAGLTLRWVLLIIAVLGLIVMSLLTYGAEVVRFLALVLGGLWGAVLAVLEVLQLKELVLAALSAMLALIHGTVAVGFWLHDVGAAILPAWFTHGGYAYLGFALQGAWYLLTFGVVLVTSAIRVWYGVATLKERASRWPILPVWDLRHRLRQANLWLVWGSGALIFHLGVSALLGWPWQQFEQTVGLQLVALPYVYAVMPGAFYVLGLLFLWIQLGHRQKQLKQELREEFKERIRGMSPACRDAWGDGRWRYGDLVGDAIRDLKEEHVLKLWLLRLVVMVGATVLFCLLMVLFGQIGLAFIPSLPVVIIGAVVLTVAVLWLVMAGALTCYTSMRGPVAGVRAMIHLSEAELLALSGSTSALKPAPQGQAPSDGGRLGTDND